MSLISIHHLLAFAPPPAQGQQPTAPFWVNLIPILLMIFVFYLILIRPQQKQAKRHQELLKTLRKGDKVVTSSGIVGVVVAVKEKTVSIRSDDAKLEILKSAVSDVTERADQGNGSKS